MFLHLNHQKLDIYGFARSFVLECYKITKALPPEEKFGMISQIRRAALSVYLNVAEGSSRKSEVDAAFDKANELNYLENHDLRNLGEYTIKCFKILSGLIDPRKSN